jgi:hypothetical protein
MALKWQKRKYISLFVEAAIRLLLIVAFWDAFLRFGREESICKENPTRRRMAV